jgi:hypothetical protein
MSLRWNDARTDSVHADALALPVHCPIAGKRAERRLGGAIDAEGRVSLDGNQRGVQDNRAAGGHQRQCSLNRKERALDVDVELLVEVFLIDLYICGERVRESPRMTGSTPRPANRGLAFAVAAAQRG